MLRPASPSSPDDQDEGRGGVEQASGRKAEEADDPPIGVGIGVGECNRFRLRAVSWAEISEAASKPDVSLVWTAIIASMATGIGAALAATASRTLALAGWSPGSVLAHLTIAAALIWLPMQGEIAVPD